jgi:MraZ protein
VRIPPVLLASAGFPIRLAGWERTHWWDSKRSGEGARQSQQEFLAMLLGRAQHSLDDKGRIVLPSQYRDNLHGPLYFALGENSEIAIWPEEGFNEKLAQKKQLELTGGAAGAREYRRFTSYASAAKVDAQFRITIPEVLREKAVLGSGGPLAIIGAGDRLEVWDAARYDEYLESESE